MRVLVTGGAGMLGRTLVAVAPSDVALHVTEHREPADHGERHRLDLANGDAVAALVDRVGPDVIVHTAYDKSDGHRGILAPSEHLAEAARRAGAGFVQLSTDVVFDGEHAPYAEPTSRVP